MDISISSSRYGITGLIGTLVSLINSAKHPELHTVHVLCCRWREQDKALFNRVMEGCKLRIRLLDFDDKKEFGAWPSFFGDWSSYTRLLAPELIQASRLLHLDSDLVINFDVGELDDFDFSGAVLSATGNGEKIKDSNDRIFIPAVTDLTGEDRSFNAGVVLYNVDAWKAGKWWEHVKAFAGKHAQSIPTADNTILVALFSRDYFELGAEYNVAWYPDKKMPALDFERAKVIHYVGAPKPWDPFGKYLHAGYEAWRLRAGAGNYLGFYEWIKRLIQIRRSLVRTLLRKYKNRKIT